MSSRRVLGIGESRSSSTRTGPSPEPILTATP
jgi:hypothetical protein